MLERVGALTKDILFEEFFSIPRNTAKGLRNYRASTEPKRGTSNHTTNNRYSIYSFMKFHKMSKAYFCISGAFSVFGREEDFYLHITTLSLDDRVRINDELEIYKAMISHFALLHSLFSDEKNKLSLDENSQVVVEAVISMLNRYMDGELSAVGNATVLENIESLRLSEYSLDILLLEPSYVYFILLFMRFSGI